MNKHQQQADGILNDISVVGIMLAEVELEMSKKIEAIRGQYAVELINQEQMLSLLKEELIELCEKHTGAVFDGADKAELPRGVLLHNKIKWVIRRKGMLATIDAAGLDRLVKEARSVDWDEVGKLDDESLAELGTERVEKASFSFELAMDCGRKG